MSAKRERLPETELDAKLAELEPIITRGQLKTAITRLHEEFERRMKSDGSQGGRSLIEKIHLISGNRRMKVLEIEGDRRQDL